MYDNGVGLDRGRSDVEFDATGRGESVPTVGARYGIWSVAVPFCFRSSTVAVRPFAVTR